MLLCQFTSLFYKTEMKMLLLIAQLFIILLVIGMALKSDVFKIGDPAASAAEFCEWIQVRTYVL